jgi:hypothetical protein
MNCYQCGNPIALLRVWRDREFCSAEHRSTYRPETRRAISAPAEAAPSLVRTSPIGRPVLSLLVGITVALPLVAATVAYVPNGRYMGSAAAAWHSLRDSVRARASVELEEDFGDDLSRWATSSGRLQNWVLDEAGFAHPGQLGIYIKSVPLADYRMDFIGQVDRKGLSFVYRAMDFENYFAARIAILQTGPIPEVALERYVVINGHAGPKTQVILPFTVRNDTLYTVHVEAQGDHFVTHINGQFVDAFSDSHLPSGGVGFFSAAGDAARVRSLRLTDRDDLLGNICSLFAPRFGN